jgi:hypothetical protein
VLKVLLQQRHLQTHSAFRREYDRVAADVDRTLKGGWPSKAQFYRWLSGDLIGLPYADHCRILEGMFPGWKVDQLFHEHDGGIDSYPNRPRRKHKRLLSGLSHRPRQSRSWGKRSRSASTNPLDPACSWSTTTLS